MDSNVAEGISTSLKPSLPVPQTLESQALEVVSSSLSTALHVNDLGLTPSPGSQLQETADVTRVPSHDEEHEFTDETERPTHLPNNLECLNHLEGDSTQTWTDKHGSAIITPEQGNGVTLDTQEDVYDPLFDEEPPVPGYEDVSCSGKRTSQEAFSLDFELWDPPGKRQHIESSQDPNVSSPDETPSLLSTDSSIRYVQGETAPQTPIGADRQQSSSLFDTFDSLFGDLENDISMDLAGGEPLPNFEQNFDISQDFSFNEAASEINIQSTQICHLNQTDNPIGMALQADGSIAIQPSMSESTKERFSLDSQDLIASTTRDILQVKKEPEYMSPYPISGGPLGYLPSAPSIHVKFIEVAEDQTNYRLSALRNKVQQLTYERNHYKKALSQWSTLDAATGKTTEQLLREENAMLRRVSSRHQSRVEQYKQEATEWKNKLHDLGVTYNNILYEIRVQKRIPEIAPVPTGYKPRRGAGFSGGNLPLSNLEFVCLDTMTPVPSDPFSQTVSPAAEQPSRPNSQPPQPQPTNQTQTATSNQGRQSNDTLSQFSSAPDHQPAPITIDLTDEQEDSSATPGLPKETECRVDTLQSLRNKKYTWLQDGPAQGRNTPSKILAPPSHSQAPPLANALEGNSLDAELVRVMEEELARG